LLLVGDAPDRLLMPLLAVDVMVMM